MTRGPHRIGVGAASSGASTLSRGRDDTRIKRRHYPGRALRGIFAVPCPFQTRDTLRGELDKPLTQTGGLPRNCDPLRERDDAYARMATGEA